MMFSLLRDAKSFPFANRIWCTISLIILLSIWHPVNAQLAAGKCKFIGNVIAGSVPTDFGNYWNQVTPENDGKWGWVEGTKDNMSWGGLDLAYNYAQTNNLPFKQHTLIWGNQQPGWIESLSPEEQLVQIEEWIESFCSRYPNTDFIDVVNEPINNPPNSVGKGNYMNALGGTGTTGIDWIIKSFELARQYCPNAKLLINEFNVLNNDSRTINYISIINKLKESDLIDGIGVQGHRFELENTSLTQIKSNLDKLGNTGLPVYISEFDLGNMDDTGTPNDALQLELYQKIFPTLWNHTAVHGITFWGYVENAIWQKTTFLRKATGVKRPAFTWLETYVSSASGGVFCLPIVATEEEINFFEIFPNPSNNGKFKVSVSEPLSKIVVYDLNGQILHRKDLANQTTAEIQLNASSGIYFVRLNTGSRTIIRKIFIQ